MKKEKIKSNKAITITDLIIAVVILMIFIGSIGTLFYEISKNTSLMRMNAIAVNYVVQIAENIDKLTYEEVNENLNADVVELYDIPNSYTVLITVENYNDNDNIKEDLIKIITIKIDYSYLGESRTYEIKKLKIKEM